MFAYRLIDALINNPDIDRVKITEDLDKLFGYDVAVLVADMSGFSSTTTREGIVAAMIAIRTFHNLGREIVERFGGEFLKSEADNFFAIFADPNDAFAAGKTITLAYPSSVGIGYGRVLLFGNDLWGDEVNKASRLGEDIAKKGEVLLTEKAQAEILKS